LKPSSHPWLFASDVDRPTLAYADRFPLTVAAP